MPIFLDDWQNTVHEKRSDEEPEKPSERMAVELDAFNTRKMPTIPQPFKDVLFEELRNKLCTEEGRA